MRTLRYIFICLIDTLFPRACAGCGTHGTLLCAECLGSVPRADQPVHPFINALFDYQNKIIRHAIWRFKYRNARGFAKHFGERLYEDIVGDLGDNLHISKNRTFLLVPIPLHKKRLRKRGYNQSELIVRAIIKHDAGNLFEFSNHALMRVRDTKSQARAEKRATRLENLRGAFRADCTLVREKDIVLVDDVTTTGATLSEARKALLKAGARSVRAYAVAH
ncbi:MAG: ComF family protein [Candidatus Yonathbacteria bacterium]|nr:ComF family protein [Candidatus Yonathbacteria bacterium]